MCVVVSVTGDVRPSPPYTLMDQCPPPAEQGGEGLGDGVFHRVCGDNWEAHHEALARCVNTGLVVAVTHNDGGMTRVASFTLTQGALRLTMQHRA